MKAMTSPSTSSHHHHHHHRHQFNAPSYKATMSLPPISSDSDSSSSVKKGRIGKPSSERRERRKVMEKLQKMVPSAKEGDSQLKLLQDIMDYIMSLQNQLEEDLANSENRHFDIDVTSLSEMLAQFTTKQAQLPLRPGQQVASH